MASCNLPAEEGRPPDRTYTKDRKYWSHPTHNVIYTPTPPPPPPDSLNNNATPSTSSSSSKNHRNSLIHHDVQEALNSLLWQPYEYQNKNKQLSSSSSSCCLSDDLDNNNNNSNKDTSSSTSSPSSSLSCCSSSSSTSDLEMVNNLHQAPLGQSRLELGSRDRFSSPTSRLRRNSDEAAIATTASLFEYLLAGEDAVESSNSDNNNSVHNLVNKKKNCSNSDVVVVEVKEWYCGDVYENKSGVMQFEVTANNNQQTTNNILSIQTTDNQNNNNKKNVLLPTAAAASLSSANVVGLPVHPRHGSEPSTAPFAPSVHARSASVPKTMPQLQNNVSNVNVNFYRAVPVNVVASSTTTAIPTIQCLNTLSEGNSVSNVQIMPLGSSSPVHNSGVVNVVPVRAVRTFTSTEAQTDEIAVCEGGQQVLVQQGGREQRRKERRERRLQKRAVGAQHRHTVDSGTQASLQEQRLPDLLNSHMPPPYSPVMVAPPPPVPVPVLQSVVPQVAFAPPPQVPLVQAAATGFRFPFPAGGFRRGRFSEEPPKGCCGLLSWKPGSLRWFIAVIALVAVCCVLVGTALGAMRPAGRDHLTVSLLMIGVGIVLVTVSGVAWRLTSHDSSTCRSMLGLGSTESVDVCTRRFVPRLPPSYGRPHHPYAAMMYPEFQYRPPPPSYQASMQEYRLRLLLLDRGNTPQMQNSLQNAVSPPPTYRSHAGSLLRAPLSSRREAAQSEYSCPPSYRSQNSTVLRSTGTLHHHHHHHHHQHASVLHSREQSLSLSETNTIRSGSEAVVNVVNILGGGGTDETDSIALDSLKLELLGNSNSDLVDGGTKDGNLVTIVQTSDQNPVIVTVSGSSQIEGSTVQITEIPTEMEILAHL